MEVNLVLPRTVCTLPEHSSVDERSISWVIVVSLKRLCLKLLRGISILLEKGAEGRKKREN